MKPPAQIRLRLLGGFALAQDGGQPSPVELTFRKAMALVAYVAMQPEQSASRETLATLLWGNSSDKQARHSLRQALASLRRDLPWPHLFAVDRHSVRLQPGICATDAREFDALTKSADPADLARAGRLFQGEFLAGFDLDEEGFHEWLLDQRRRVALAADRLCESYATRPQLADGQGAIAFAEGLIAIDPLREDRWRWALTLYARYRGRTEALAQAVILADRLKRELDVAPEDETLALIEDIRRGAIAPAQPSADIVAAPPSPGRTGGLPPVEAHAGPGDIPGTLSAGADRPLSARLGRRFPWASRRPPGRAASAGLAALALAIVAGGAVVMYNRSLPAHVGNPAEQVPPAAPTVAADPWQSPRTRQSAADPGQPRRKITAIAVLPIRTYGETAGSLQLMADMITDDLINTLSRFGPIRVISRQTVRSYTGQPIDVASIGEQLGVRYILEASMRMQGDKLRVNAELVDPTTRLPVWLARIEHDGADRHAVVDEIVGRLANELNFEMIAIGDNRSRDAGAEALVHQGFAALWSAFSNSGIERFRKAEALFRKALERDPNLFYAQLGLAAFNANVAAQRLVPDPIPYFAEAERLLQDLARRDPTNANSHFFMGFVHVGRGNFPEAIDAFERTLELNPSHASAHAHLGNALVQSGRPADGLEHMRYAMRLSPRDPNLAYWYEFVGNAELELGRYQEAIDDFRRSSEMNAGYLRSWAGLAAAHALAGHGEEARGALDKLAALVPDTPRARLADRFGRRKGDRLHKGLRLALDGATSSQ